MCSKFYYEETINCKALKLAKNISTMIISCYKILRYSYQVHIVGEILVHM